MVPLSEAFKPLTPSPGPIRETTVNKQRLKTNWDMMSEHNIYNLQVTKNEETVKEADFLLM